MSVESGKEPVETHPDELRPFIKRAVAKMAVSVRFESAENDALESLVELYCALIHSIAEMSREYCEHGNRCIPMIHDIISATTHLGFNLDDNVKNLIAEERNTGNKYTVDKEESATIADQPPVKTISTRKKHAFYVNDFLPPYPEPHTYISTPAVCSNAYKTDFEEVKQSYTTNVRHTQEALAKFAAKMQIKLRPDEGTVELIPNDPNTSVITPPGTELHDYKALNVHEDMEWSSDPKLPTIVENATAQQISQNPYIKPPKMRKT